MVRNHNSYARDTNIQRTNGVTTHKTMLKNTHHKVKLLSLLAFGNRLLRSVCSDTFCCLKVLDCNHSKQLKDPHSCRIHICSI